MSATYTREEMREINLSGGADLVAETIVAPLSLDALERTLSTKGVDRKQVAEFVQRALTDGRIVEVDGRYQRSTAIEPAVVPRYSWQAVRAIAEGDDVVEPGGPTVLVLESSFGVSWPVAHSQKACTMSLRELCLHRWPSDVHFVGYRPTVAIGEPPTAESLGFDASGRRTRKKKVEQVDDELTNPIARRYDNEAVGHFRFELNLWIADVDDPVAHVTKRPARVEWLALMERKMANVAEKHPRVFAFTTRGGVRILFQREAPFVIESEKDKDRFLRAEYPAFVRYLGHEFDIRVDPNCANFSRLFRAPFVRRKVGASWQDQESRFIGDPAQLEVL